MQENVYCRPKLLPIENYFEGHKTYIHVLPCLDNIVACPAEGRERMRSAGQISTDNVKLCYFPAVGWQRSEHSRQFNHSLLPQIFCPIYNCRIWYKTKSCLYEIQTNNGLYKDNISDRVKQVSKVLRMCLAERWAPGRMTCAFARPSAGHTTILMPMYNVLHEFALCWVYMYTSPSERT